MTKSIREFPAYKLVAQSWWSISDEIFRWKYTLVTHFPGKIGCALRANMLQKLCAKRGVNVSIEPGLQIENPTRLSIGDNVRISRNCYFSAGGGVSIGNNILFGPYVQLWSINHRYDDLSKNIMDQGYENKEIIIEDDCWIGAGVEILAGVIVGKGSVIGAGAILRRSVKPYSIVIGNPGKIVSSRIKENSK